MNEIVSFSESTGLISPIRKEERLMWMEKLLNNFPYVIFFLFI
jgi:hypothetical protein